MIITIRVFAGLAEKMGGASITLETDKEQLTADELKTILKEQHPHSAETIAVSMIAKNQSYATSEEVITAEDELAIIPPVSGGQPATHKRAVL